jgi:hypothetical protein
MCLLDRRPARLPCAPLAHPSPRARLSQTGPKRDLVGQLAAALRAEGLSVGLYYSLLEWFHPMYLRDRGNKHRTSEYVEQVRPSVSPPSGTQRPLKAPCYKLCNLEKCYEHQGTSY